MYNLTQNGFECKYIRPELNPLEYEYVNIYNLCSGARDGMSGAIDYAVIISMARANGVTDLEDVMFYTKECENILNQKRQNERKNK